jgi:GT2 family glycosyltransferase
VVNPEGVPLRGNDWSVLDGRVPDRPPAVSVIVAHYEQQPELDRTLAALARQDHPAALLEIVVVDDGSAEPPRVPHGVTLVVQQDRGFRLAAARNAGAAVATGDVLCFLDADTAPEPGYIRALTRLPALAPDVLAVGRRRHAALDGVPLDADLVEVAPSRELTEPAWLADAYSASRNLLDADDRSYRFVIGAVVACSTALFRATGGFDETFDQYGGEDWEWAYRAWLAGAVLAHVPDAVAWHDGPQWAGRPEARHATKNAEALRLANRIPVPGSAPRGLPGEAADIVVELPTGASVDDPAWFVTLDSIAVDLPRAALPGDGRRLESARVRLRILRPVRVDEGALRGAVAEVGRNRVGTLTGLDASGMPLLVVEATRAAARAERWGRTDLFDSVDRRVPGIEAMGDVVDVEAYLGGWG